MQNRTRFLAAILVLVTIFAALFSAACTTGGMVALASTPEPTPTVTPTSTPSPTLEPTPTMDPVPDLTDEEVKAEMDLLGIIDPYAEKEITGIYLVFYSNTDENGCKEYKVEFASGYLRLSTNTQFMSSLWDDQPMFEFSHDYDIFENVSEQYYITPRLESLKNSKVEMLTTVNNLEYFCKQFGIPYQFPNTRFASAVKEVQHSSISSSDEKWAYINFACFYIEAFAKANRVAASDLWGPIEYVAPPKTPAPTATVTPN